MDEKVKFCPECRKRIQPDEMYFMAPDEGGDYGAGDQLFPFHPKCWAHGDCLGPLKEHTCWLIGLAAATLNTLRTEYDPADVPECAFGYLPELDQALAGLRQEVDLLRFMAMAHQVNLRA